MSQITVWRIPTTANLSSEAEDMTEPSSKRQRVSLACSACRVRKSKCTGERPRCKLCLRMKLECVYEVPGHPPSSGEVMQKDIVDDLYQRISVLSKRVTLHAEKLGLPAEGEANADSGGGPVDSSKSPYHHLQRQPSSINIEPAGGLNQPKQDFDVNDDPEQNDTDDSEDIGGATDGMGITFVKEEDCAFFGPSSNIALMRHVLSAMSRHGNVNDPPPPPPTFTPPSAAPSATPPSTTTTTTTITATNVTRTGQSRSHHAPPSHQHHHHEQQRVRTSNLENRTANTNDRTSSKGLITSLIASPETEALLKLYFANTGLLFPFIHEESFLATYASLKSQQGKKSSATSASSSVNGSGLVRRTWLALLHIVLALSTYALGRKGSSASSSKQHAPTTGSDEGRRGGGDDDSIPEEEEDQDCGTQQQSEYYFARAQELLGGQHMLRGSTLETVQFLLLTCQYLQGTSKSVQTWTTHGLAVKYAMAIGLHYLPHDTCKASESHRRNLEKEMRTRVWWGCVVLDRHLSMTLGRPCAIPEEYIRVPLPEAIAGDGDKGRGVGFFRATIQLYKPLNKIISLLYNHNLGDNDRDSNENHKSDIWTISQIFQLEQELNEWESALPVGFELRLRHSAIIVTEDVIAERYRVILSLRFLSTKLLLHRPIFVKSLRAMPMASSMRSMGEMRRRSNTAAVRAAEEIVALVHQVLSQGDTGRRLLGAWWFTLWYVFHASLIIFGSALIPATEIEVATNESRLLRIQEYLQKAIVALDLLDSDNPLLESCGAYTASLLQIVQGWIASEVTAIAPPPMFRRKTMSSLPLEEPRSNRTFALPKTAQLQLPSPVAPQAFKVPVAKVMQSDLLKDQSTSDATNGRPLTPMLFDPAFDDLFELGPFFNGDLQQWLPGGDGLGEYQLPMFDVQ